ncbi:MAG: hypothetical protein COT73_03720 [Bdellovibrio sp. CG10_big_fil_rev_8_21_14_0_10_47_8]|nr:MAG: hypothetical protein COT73_03720 [Bdellovibrio sp. CG10_big_fil_rev_8_21_14_0_10_47_8]
MKKAPLLWKATVGIFISLFCMNTDASKFKGYGRAPGKKPMILTESVERIEEGGNDFLILLSRHAALYRFPKSNEYASQVRSFLKQRMKSKKPIVVTIDPLTAQIFYIEDPAP